MSEPELMPDAPAQPATDAQPSAKAIQPASAEDAFCMRMDSKFKRERNYVAATIREDMDIESKRREEADAELEEQIDLVLQGVAKLEMDDRPQEIPRINIGADAWQATHVIFGGWGDAVTNPERVADVDHLCRLLPSAMQNQQLRPWAPNKPDGNVVTLRWTNTVAAAAAQFTLAPRLLYSTGIAGRLKKVWLAVERHPENTKRGGVLRDVADAIATWSHRNAVRHHVGHGRVSLGGRRVLHTQNDQLVAAPDYFEEPTLKERAWTPVPMTLSR